MLLDNLLAVQKSEKKWGEVLDKPVSEKEEKVKELEDHDCKGVECESCANWDLKG